MKAKIYVDGSTTDVCYVVFLTFGDNIKRLALPVATIVQPAVEGRTVTNNEGEYLAVIHALEHARYMGYSEVEILSDSLLVVNQFNGEWKIKEPRLRRLCGQACGLALSLTLTLKWIPREINLAGQVLEGRKRKK